MTAAGKTFKTCSLSGCNRQALQRRDDGLCYDHGTAADEADKARAIDDERLKHLHRVETDCDPHDSLVQAVVFLLGREI